MNQYIIFALCFIFLSGCLSIKTIPPQTTQEPHTKEDDILILSFLGDNILGDYYGSNGETLNWYFENKINKDYSYFFAEVLDILKNDDMTLANLEGPLTTHNDDKLDKPFAFKGSPDYVKILKNGSIEAVNIANNHTRDYGMQGFKDTQTHLQNADIFYSGEGILSIYEVKGKKIGMAGHRGWNLSIKNQVKNEIQQLREKGADIVIFTFHWGEERKNYPNEIQKEIGRFAIDNGADVVIGHHPHVLQGIEEYKGRKIIYSLGNFVYGGAKNPADKDSIIYQIHFAFSTKHEELENIAKQVIFIDNPRVKKINKMAKWIELHSFVPVLISGEKTKNNYQPVIAKDTDKDRIITRMNTYSKSLSQ